MEPRGNYESSVVVRQLPGASCFGRAWEVQHLRVGSRRLGRIPHGDVAVCNSRGSEARDRERFRRRLTANGKRYND